MPALTSFARTVGCGFLGLHWPDRRPIWDGDSFVAGCRVCQRDLRRQAPGLWRTLPDRRHPAWRDLPPDAQLQPAARPDANFALAAAYLLDALAVLDGLADSFGPAHPQSRQVFAAAAYTQTALDALTRQPTSQPGQDHAPDCCAIDG